MTETMKNNIITDQQIVSDILGLDISDVDMMLGVDAFDRLQTYMNALEAQVGCLTEFIDELQDNEDLLNVETFDGQVNALRETLAVAKQNVEDNYELLETEETVQERYVDMADEPEALEAKRLMAGGYSEATTEEDPEPEEELTLYECVGCAKQYEIMTVPKMIVEYACELCDSRWVRKFWDDEDDQTTVQFSETVRQRLERL